MLSITEVVKYKFWFFFHLSGLRLWFIFLPLFPSAGIRTCVGRVAPASVWMLYQLSYRGLHWILFSFWQVCFDFQFLFLKFCFDFFPEPANNYVAVTPVGDSPSLSLSFSLSLSISLSQVLIGSFCISEISILSPKPDYEIGVRGNYIFLQKRTSSGQP